MSELNPTLQGGIGYTSPTGQASRTTSVIGGIDSLFGALVNTSRPKDPPAPTAKDRAGTSLRPLAKRLEQLRNSNMSDSQFTNASRKEVRNFIVENPEYADDAKGLISVHGVEAEPLLEVTPEEMYTKGFNTWTESTEGQSAFISSAVFKGGALDEEATRSKLHQSYANSQKEAALLAESKRVLETLETGDKTYDLKAKEQVKGFMPLWYNKAADAANNLVLMASMGDEAVDTFEEQVAYLRNTRRAFLDGYTSKAVTAGIPSTIYETEITKALAPLDNLLALANSSVEDKKSWLALEAQLAEQGVRTKFVETFGAIGASEPFQKMLMEVSAQKITANMDQEDYERIWGFFATAQERAGAGNSLTDFTFLPTIRHLNTEEAVSGATSVVSPEAVSTAIHEQKQDPKLLSTVVESVGSTIQYAEDPGTALDVFSQIMVHSKVSNAPLTGKYLTSILSNTNVAKLRELSKGDSAQAKDLKLSITEFVAEQSRRNKGVVISALNAMNSGNKADVWSVREGEGKNKFAVVLRNGKEYPMPTNLSGVGNKELSLFLAVENINKLYRAGETINEGFMEEVTNPENQNFEGQSKEIQDHLDMVNPPTGLPRGRRGERKMTTSSRSTAPEEDAHGNGPIASNLGIDFDRYEREAGLPTGYLERMAMIESSGDPTARPPIDPATGKRLSSAGGLFQQLDANAKEFGVEDKFDPVQSTEGAVKFAVRNKNTLSKVLGRDPYGWELYLAHQQGGTGASKLLSADQKAKAADIVGLAAVTNNGGHANMSVGEFLNIWASKFNGQRGPTSMSEATGRPRESFIRPKSRPEDTTATDFAPTSSVRPQSRTAGDPSNSSVQSLDGSQGTEGSREVRKAVSGQANDVLVNTTMKTLQLLGLNPDDYLTEEDAERAIEDALSDRIKN